MKNLRQRTVSGLGWNAVTQALAKALQFAVLIVLAHLLSPHEFGLIGMILIFTGFASSIADMGLGASIVQAQVLSDENLNSVFWLNIALGVHPNDYFYPCRAAGFEFLRRAASFGR